MFENSKDLNHKQVVIVVNKWWECNPTMNVLLNDDARPASTLGWPKLLHFPCKQHEFSSDPRAVFTLSNVQVEIWCISDLLAKFPDTPEYQSSSERKMEVLPSIFQYSDQQADLVIAVGTAAAYPHDTSVNGSVICGTKVFMHDGHPDGTNPHSNWETGPFDVVIDSGLSRECFNRITNIETDPPTVMDRFLVSPLNPDPMGGRLIADHDYVSLGTINVTDYSEYETKDNETLASYQKLHDPKYGVSLETTHALIRKAAPKEAQFLFVSGIVNRVGFFGEDVEPRSYAQNTTGAHNAGIVIAWMLPKIIALYSRNL